VKLRELLAKFRRPPSRVEGDERSAESLDKAFTAAWEKAPGSFVPSQQDERPH
jgi:hypothetical protein